MKILVIGAGAVGGTFGAKLVHAGQDVTFVARGAHAQALRRAGLRVRPRRGEALVVPVRVADDGGAGLEPHDIVLVCVKSYDTAEALARVRGAVSVDTTVLMLQNGVDRAEAADAVLGAGRTLPGAVYLFAAVAEPGVIDHLGGGRIVFGEPAGGRSARAERLRDVLAGAGIAVELAGDVRRSLWEKYVYICAQAGITALTRRPTGVLRALPDVMRVYRRLLDELHALATAAGVTLPADIADDVLGKVAKLAPDSSSSLALDLALGRRLELETLHGHASRLARGLGVAVPTVDAVYAALLPHAAGRPP